MSGLTRVIALLLLPSTTAFAEEPAPIPLDVQQHMRAMVGAWTFSGRQGERTFSGEEAISLTESGDTLVQKGFFDLGGGKKEHYAIFSGWDGSKKTVLVHGFTTDGVVWEGEWKSVDGATWSGTASGQPATFEVNETTMRYEDAGDGTPWVTEFRRVAQENSEPASPERR